MTCRWLVASAGLHDGYSCSGVGWAREPRQQSIFGACGRVSEFKMAARRGSHRAIHEPKATPVSCKRTGPASPEVLEPRLFLEHGLHFLGF